MAAMALDPYTTLGIPPAASRNEAARAHRRLAKHRDLDDLAGVAPGRDASNATSAAPRTPRALVR